MGKYNHVTEEIFSQAKDLRSQGNSQERVARMIGVSPTTIWRVDRADNMQEYRTKLSQEKGKKPDPKKAPLSERPKGTGNAVTQELLDKVKALEAEGYSMPQIALRAGTSLATVGRMRHANTLDEYKQNYLKYSNPKLGLELKTKQKPYKFVPEEPVEQTESPLDRLDTVTLKARIANTDKYVDVLVDGDYDGEYLSQYKWCVGKAGYVYHTDKSEGNSFRYLHKLVLPPKKGYWTHFINGNRLDCRSANLEYVTPSQSALLRPQGERASTSTGLLSSKYRGVGKSGSINHQKGRYYIGNIWVAKAQKQVIGYFDNEEEAARAYDKKAKEIWGENAILNFPDEKQIKETVQTIEPVSPVSTGSIRQDEVELAKALEADGVSQENIAKLMGRTQGSVSRILTGIVTGTSPIKPRVTSLDRVVQLLESIDNKLTEVINGRD